MKTLLIFTLLAFCCAPAVLAQTPGDGYPRVEFYGGVATEPDGVPAVPNTLARLPATFTDRTTYKGFEASATVNVTRYVGIKGDFSGMYATREFLDLFPCRRGDPNCDPCVIALTCPDAPVGFTSKSSLYQFLGGVQLKDNSREARIKPFGHALAGVARVSYTFVPRDDQDPPFCLVCAKFDVASTGFAAVIGGGLDVRLNRHFDLRVVQLDYNPTRLGGQTQHNLSLGAGIVVR